MFFANNRGEMAPDNGGGFTPPTYLQQRTPTQAPPSQPQTEPTFSAPGAGTAQTGFRAPVDEGGGEVLPKDGQTPFPQQSPQTYNPVAAPMPIEHPAPPPSPAFTPQPPTPVQQEIQPEQQLAASGRNVYDAPPPSAFTPAAPTPVAEPIAPPAQIAPAPQASFTPQAPTPVMQPANPAPQQLSMLASAPQEGGMAPTNTNGLWLHDVNPIAPAAAGGANTNFSPAAGGAATAPQTPTAPQGAVAPQSGNFSNLGQMILDKLKTPSTYDDSTMQNAIANNEAQLKTQEDAGLSGVDADMAARGLLMGSPDVIDRSKIRNNIQQARSNFDTNITMDRAHTMAADNAQAFGNAFNFVGQGQQQQQLDNGQQFNWAQLAAELGNLNAPNPNSALGAMPMSQPNFGGIDPATLQAIGALFAKQGGGAAPAAGSGNSPVSGASIY